MNDNDPIPLDEYLRRLKNGTAEGSWPDLESDEEEMMHDLYADDYTSGIKYVCVHCNTAFNSMRHEPECPFCHKMPII